MVIMPQDNWADNYQPEEQTGKSATWVDYLVETNPHGVMEVLSRRGYIGYLSPQDHSELVDAAYHYIEVQGEQGVVDLLRVHPLYDTIAEIVREENTIPLTFKNAAGEVSEVLATIKTINYKKLIETILVLIGAYFIIDKALKYLFKKE